MTPIRLLAILLSCLALSPLARADAASAFDKSKAAVNRGAEATMHGIKRGAEATRHGLEVGLTATGHGIQRGVDATSNAFHKVANKVRD